PGSRAESSADNPAEEDDMGLFFRPRRPLLRLATGAATASIAYRAGQRRAEQDEFNQQAAEAYQGMQAPPPAPAPAGPAPDTIAELERLSRLHESGALTDQEFTAAKARALGL
ncbi:MAG TPA: SHOCT domain-containing protein, partial [Actinomycetota bacterium]